LALGLSGRYSEPRQDITDIEDMTRMPQLTALLAEHAGQLVNYSTLGTGIGVSGSVVRHI
jgi:hypothetical protein